MTEEEKRDLISYMFMLIFRSPIDYWDTCEKITNADPNILGEELKIKINKNLQDKHEKSINIFCSHRVNIEDKINLKYRFLDLNRSINFIGESIGIFFETMNLSTKDKIYSSLAEVLYLNSKINLTKDEWLENIKNFFSLALIIPYEKGLIYLQNNWNNYNINDNLGKEILYYFYNYNIYFQIILMTSINQLVVIDLNEAKKTYCKMNKAGTISQIVNKDTNLYKIYLKYHRELKKTKTDIK